MLPTILRELLRSTLYSSRRPFSSNATRDSSFSTLNMSLLQVLREERPKIFLTLSIIKVKGSVTKNATTGKFCSKVSNRKFIEYHDVGWAAGAVAQAPVDDARRRAVRKSYGVAASPLERPAQRELVASLFLESLLQVLRQARHP